MICIFRIFLLVISIFVSALSLHAQCVQGDCVNGQGTYIYPSGAKYIGHFKNGEIHGIGVCYYSDGSKYQGEWKNRYPEGKGTRTYSDGYVRTGYWRKGKPVDEKGNPVAEYVVAKPNARQDDGTDVQSGCISGDCKNGVGVFAYPDGSKFEGAFVNGKFEGEGVFYFANGDRYNGHFHAGYPDGFGVRTNADGSVESGEWKQGEYVGNPLSKDGKAGCVQGDCENGAGIYVFKAGAARYEGEFKDGMPHGKGFCVYANGDTYQGEWAEGAFNGMGILKKRDGTSVSGYWKDGEFAGTTDPATPEPAPVAPTPAPLTLPKVWAVVVGVAAYDHMPALRYTDDDAYRFYAFLKSIEGGALPDQQVRLLIDEDATRENILSALEEVFSMAEKQDLVVFYFSGHGLNGSFLPINFDGFNNKIGHDEIADLFNKCRARNKLCLADACHSGSLFAMRSTGEEPILTQYYQTLAKSISGTALLMSSKSDETSLESSGLRQGVFSHFLIRGLKGEADKNKDKLVTLQELYDFIYQNVRAYTGNRQSPVIKGTFDPMMPVAVVR